MIHNHEAERQLGNNSKTRFCLGKDLNKKEGSYTYIKLKYRNTARIIPFRFAKLNTITLGI